MLAEAASEICGFNMIGMNRISIERRTVAEDGDESRIVRTRQSKYIEADFETLNFRDDLGQTPQSRNVFLARCRLNINTIFPDDDMCQHEL